MKKQIVVYISIMTFISGIISCTKTSFITNPDALFRISSDSLHFDTVFTSTGSVTQAFKIFNPNNQKLRLSNLQLEGGVSSFFKINVDGMPGTSFANIDLDANDSLYVFVSVSIDPNASNLPFIVQDSILIVYNGNRQFVQLDAYGKNAHFLNNAVIEEDTSWNSNLPFVVLGSLTVSEGKTLIINKGTKIYSHANAPVIVNGTLKTEGEKYDSARVTFLGDRLDDPYKNFPGSWPGILFSAASTGNLLTYAVIKNAYQGVVATGQSINGNTKVILNECVIDNIYDAGILGNNSSIDATNCLVTNCGNNIRITGGGSYHFTHCTAASFTNNYLDHKSPVLTINNTDDNNNALPFTGNFVNCIFWSGAGGTVDDEIVINKQGNASFNLVFENILYKAKNDLAANFAASIKNEDPLFINIDAEDNYYDFHLQAASPCVNAGINAGVLTDLDGNPRSITPSIGCYEPQ